MITEDYVSFETAKLLKEKGFDGECDLFGRTDESELIIRKASKIAYNQGIDDECVILPTLQMTMKWLREVHHLFIGIEYVNILGLGFVYQSTIGKFDDDYMYCLCKNSYEEACETAIKYCLENLI